MQESEFRIQNKRKTKSWFAALSPSDSWILNSVFCFSEIELINILFVEDEGRAQTHFVVNDFDLA